MRRRVGRRAGHAPALCAGEWEGRPVGLGSGWAGYLKRRQDEPAPGRDPLQDGVVTRNRREHNASPCAPAFRHRPWRFPTQYGTGLNSRTVSDQLAQFDDEYRASR